VDSTPNTKKRSVWHGLRRQGALAFLGLSEHLMRLIGRRKPYGVLKLDIAGELAEEESGQRILGLLRRPSDDYFALITLLRWAREDPALSGIFIRCEQLHASWARLQGLRRAIQRVREAGKHVWVHLNSGGVREYYVATAAERVSLTPAATLDIAGLSSEVVFFLGALEKIGVQADIVQMGRYKSAGESFTRRDMSIPHREMAESLIDDLYGQLVEGVATDRGLEPAVVREIFDRGPFLACEALDGKLVDEIAYEDEVEARLLAACGESPTIQRRDYFRRRSHDARRRALREARGTFALLHVCGTIKSGESVPGPEGTGAVGSKVVAAALKELRERGDIQAVILRVSSPGGSATASDLIWREVVRTREQKPVVISCGDVAASGGYYVAVAGTPVLAEAGTITGSIGVIAGRATLRGLYERLGVTKELVQRGRHASLYSDYAPLGEEERARIQAEAASFYDTFVGKVVAGRQLSADAVAAAAEGRVWTGRQAWMRGLIDEVGGFEEAVAAAKRLVGLAPEAVVAIERYPKPRRLWKLSLDLNLPGPTGIAELLGVLPSVRYLLRERVWAILPFHLRFF